MGLVTTLHIGKKRLRFRVRVMVRVRVRVRVSVRATYCFITYLYGIYVA